MAPSLPHKDIVKKRRSQFIRFQAHQFKRIGRVRLCLTDCSPLNQIVASLAIGGI